jgi:hypothetical protein
LATVSSSPPFSNGSFAVALVGLLLPACRQDPPPWQCDAMQGLATIHGDGVEVHGRVTFVRPRSAEIGTLQLDVEQAGHNDNATLLASGKTTAFTDGVPRTIRTGEERALAVLAVLFGWPGTEGERSVSGDGCVVRMGDGKRYTVTLVPVATGKPHHG